MYNIENDPVILKEANATFKCFKIHCSVAKDYQILRYIGYGYILTCFCLPAKVERVFGDRFSNTTIIIPLLDS